MGSSVLPLSPTMKSLLVLFLAVGVSQAAVTCDECRAAAQDFVSHLLSAEGLAEQTEAMKANVCPQLGIDGCEGILDMWYGDMAKCIFNHFILEGDVCSLSGLADYMVQDETVAQGVAYLQGECFCGAEGHTEDCPALVEAVLPLAFPVLADFLSETAVEHCQEIAGVC